MPLDRILEPELMDSPQEATDYDAMDHSAVNRVFVDDLLSALGGSGFRVQGSEQAEPVPSTHSVPSTSNTSANPQSTMRNPHSPEPRTLNPPRREPSSLDVLDLGTGTALIPIELCKSFADCRVVAADAAVSMLELARYNVEVNSLTDRIELARVDAKRLPFADALFDVVMSNSIVHHIPEPIHVLREAVRVAKPGGLLFVRDLLRPGSDDDLQHLVDTYTAGANIHQRQMFADSLHAALSLAEIRALIASLGFAADSVQQNSDRHWTWRVTR